MTLRIVGPPGLQEHLVAGLLDPLEAIVDKVTLYVEHEEACDAVRLRLVCVPKGANAGTLVLHVRGGAQRSVMQNTEGAVLSRVARVMVKRAVKELSK